jgi:hypothetical protein
LTGKPSRVSLSKGKGLNDINTTEQAVYIHTYTYIYPKLEKMFKGNDNNSEKGNQNCNNTDNNLPENNLQQLTPQDAFSIAKALISQPLSSDPLQPQQQPPLPTLSIPNLPPHPDFYMVHSHLSHPLVPLVSITTGLPHPYFPTTLLQYHLLTASQLDTLAAHYHQTSPPIPQTYGYPIHVRTWVGDAVPLETKRRRWGRFIGLRGCESPVEGPVGGDAVWGDGSGQAGEIETEEEMLERLEREWEEALRRARSEDDDRLLRYKAGGI